MAKKTACPVSRAEFAAQARPLPVQIGDKTYTAVPKEFSTGSLGWNINDKVVIDIGGKPVTVQIGLNLTVVGSKELPKDEVAVEAPQEAPAA